MGLFSFLFGKKEPAKEEKQQEEIAVEQEPVNETPQDLEEEEEPTQQEELEKPDEGAEPSEIKHAPICKFDAWRKYPEGTINLDSYSIVGISFNNDDGVSRRKIINNLQKYEELYLKHEPNNPKDKNAIAIWSAMGKIGYIPKDETLDILGYIEYGFAPRAKFYGPVDRYGNFVCRVYVQMLKPDSCKFYRCKVVGIRTAEQKENVENLRYGDPIDLFREETNSGNEYICVNYCGDNKVGQLEKKDEKILLDLIDTKKIFAMTISNITEDDLYEDEDGNVDPEDKKRLGLTIGVWVFDD